MRDAPAEYLRSALANLLLDVAQGFIIKATKLLQAADFFANFHFIESLGTALRTTLFFLAETQLANTLQDAGLLDAPRKAPNERFSGFFLFSFNVNHSDLLSVVTQILFKRARVLVFVPLF